MTEHIYNKLLNNQKRLKKQLEHVILSNIYGFDRFANSKLATESVRVIDLNVKRIVHVWLKDVISKAKKGLYDSYNIFRYQWQKNLIKNALIQWKNSYRTIMSIS